MNKQEREQYMKDRIFVMLERIENKTGKMAHEISELKDELKQWQDGKLKTSFFNMTVMNFFEGLE